MSIRTIRQCDRCKREISNSSLEGMRTERIKGKDLDLCRNCGTKLDLFLSGRELDEPP